MAVDTSLAKLYFKEIQTKLLKEGISEEDSVKVLQDLEESLYDEISAEAINTMTAEEQEEFEKAEDEKMTPDELSDLMGISQEDIMEQMLYKLEDFMEHFQEELPAIKQKLQQTPQTTPAS